MKVIPGFPNYTVDELGNVYNKKKKLLKPFIQNGYRYVSLYNDSGIKKCKISRIVCLTYLPQLDKSKIYVNHIDGIKNNDCLSNLEWVTPGENTKHAYDNNLMSRVGERHNRAILNESDVIEIRKLYQNGLTQKEIGKKFKVSRNCIYSVLSGKNWSHV